MWLLNIFKKPSETNGEDQDVPLTQNITITDEEKNKKKSELDKLIEEAGTYRSSKEYEKLFNFIKRFPKMAPYNAMLINMQRPGSTFVASVKDWKNKYGRYPKPGASPLIILKAFGPVSYVYELSDTEGRDFPKDLEKPFNSSGTISDWEFNNLKKALPFLGVELYQSKYGTDLAGTAESKEEIKVFDYKNKQFYIPFSITVNEDHDTSTQFATICHELGHILCGHLYYPKSMIKEETYLPTRFGISKDTKEFEAESVCWLVCERIGIKNPSAKYLSNYLKNNDMVPYISLEAILRATGTIERMLKGDVIKPHKALVIKA